MKVLEMGEPHLGEGIGVFEILCSVASRILDHNQH